MKKIIKLATVVLAVIALASCQNEVSFPQADLQGVWLDQNGQQDTYYNFTTEKTDEEPFLWGYEWLIDNENSDNSVLESDVLAEKHGNGWFKYKLVKTELTEIHMLTISEALSSVTHKVTKLTDTELSFTDEGNRVHNCKKVVRTK